MSLVSTVYGTTTSGRVVVRISYGWSSLTQSQTYSIPASARRSGVSHVSVRPGPSQPRGARPVNSRIVSTDFRMTSRWSGTAWSDLWT